MKKITLVFALLAVAFSAAASAAVNNGSFETPVFTSMTPFVGVGSSATANGWNWFGGSGGIYGENQTIYPGQYGPAPNGTQWIEWSNGAYAYQSLGVVSGGQSYQLSFWVGQDTSANPVAGGTTGALELTNGTSTVTLASVIDSAPVARTWKQFQTGMTQVAPQYNNWSLVVRMTHNSAHWEGLDNVAVTAVMPEPGSLIALGSGLIGLMGMMIRKRG